MSLSHRCQKPPEVKPPADGSIQNESNRFGDTTTWGCDSVHLKEEKPSRPLKSKLKVMSAIDESGPETTRNAFPANSNSS